MNSSSTTLDFSAYIAERTKDFTGREWVFKTIDAWLSDGKEPQFFILTGEPGVGKSAIAARLTQIREPAAYHFCIARQADTTDPLNFARSISQQLCRFDGFARGILKDSGTTVTAEQNIQENYGQAIGIQIEKLFLNPQSALVAFTHSVVEPLKALCGNDGGEKDEKSPLLILVDGLDEAAQRTGETIVDLLANAGNVPAQVRFLLTSRPEGAALDQFEHLEIPFHLLDAGAEENLGDVHEYLDQQVEDSEISADLRAQLAASGVSQQVFVERLMGASGGNFLYLSFLLPSIASGAQPLDKLEDLPQGLDSVYREFLRTRTVGKGRREWRGLYRPLLGALTAAQAPLNRAQLLQFTGLDAQDLEDGLQDVGQFLDPASAREARYQLYHQSLPDFLGDRERAKEFWIDLEAVHTRIADSYWSRYDDWSQCDVYGLRYLPVHLSEAGEGEKLRALLLDFGWLQAKLDRLGIYALLADFDLDQPGPDDATPALRQALEQGAHVLAQDRAQLPQQLLGRLLEGDNWRIDTLRSSTRQLAPRPCLLPHSASLRQSRDLLRVFAGHVDPVTGVAVTHDGRAISSATDGFVMVWDLATGRELHSFLAHLNGVNAVGLTPVDGLLVSASNDKTLKVWDLSSYTERHALEGHTAAVNALAVTYDGQLVISASGDRTLKVWNLSTGQELRTLKGHQDAVNGVAVTQDGRVVSASSDGTLRVWDLASGEELRSFPGHTGSVRAVAVTPDGRLVVSVSDDAVVRVWDLTDGHEIRTLQGHTFEVRTVALTPNGRLALSGAGSISGGDNTIKVWDLKTGELRHTFQGHAGAVNAIAVTPDSRFVISASWDRTLRLWELAAIDRPADAPSPTDWINSLTADPNGQFVVSASRNKLKVWGIGGGAEQRMLASRAEEIYIRSVALTPDGQLAISASSDGAVQAWDLRTGREQQAFRGHPERVYAVAVTPDGQRIISASKDHTLKLWDMASGAELGRLRGHTDKVYAVAVTPDGQLAVSGSADQTLKVWDLATCKRVRTLKGHDDAVYAVAITSDGRAISASFDHTLKVWELATGKNTGTLRGHSHRILGVAVTPDGRRVISAARDHTLRVWELASEKCVATFRADSRLRACVLLPGSGLIATGGDSGQVHLLRLEESM